MARTPRRQISPKRKGLYYGGMVLIGVGLIVFISTILTGPRPSDGHAAFESGMESMMVTALVGMGLLALGGFLMYVGAAGAAGSGVILDPEKAREDLEPWARMGGGMLGDALDEAGVSRGKTKSTVAAVKVRCRECKTLNDEDARFCDHCGAEL